MPPFLKGGHDPEFMLRRDPGKYVGVLQKVPQLFVGGVLDLRACHYPVAVPDTHLFCYNCGSKKVVPCDHLYPDPCPVALFDRINGFRSGGVHYRGHSQEGEVFLHIIHVQVVTQIIRSVLVCDSEETESLSGKILLNRSPAFSVEFTGFAFLVHLS